MDKTLHHIEMNNLAFSEEDVTHYYDSVFSDGLYDFEINFLKEINYTDFDRIEILNPGCGAGREAIHLAKQGATVTAFDCSSQMLEMARQNIKAQNVSVHVIQSNGFGLPIKSEFDLIFGTHNYISHVLGSTNRIKLLTELSSKLKPNGMIVFSFHNRMDYKSKHYNYWKSIEKNWEGGEKFFNYNLELGDKFVPIVENYESKILFHFFNTNEIEYEAHQSNLIVRKMMPIYGLGMPPFKWSESVWFVALSKL